MLIYEQWTAVITAPYWSLGEALEFNILDGINVRCFVLIQHHDYHCRVHWNI